MRQPILIFAGAIAAGLAGGFVFREPSNRVQAETASQEWTPRNTIKRDPLTSAAELDGQQPAVAAFSPVQRQAPMAATVSTWSYRNCAAARAAGAAPIYRGQPGYGAHMDGDGDGIACEPYPR
ncbi:excalibur calcium-binding domain-containing protein [Sphingobium sp. AS12]|nr:excalibur calcium-binding domain-containing protein [Sphingobium sp. AS12]